MTLPENSSEHLASLVAKACGRDAQGILRLALAESFPGRTAVVSSFGTESAVLLHLVAEIDPNTPVLFINTGKLFGETLRYRDRLQRELGLSDVRAIGPNGRELAAADPEESLWSRNPDTCCTLRKVAPLRRALAGFDALVTGRKRFQTGARSQMEPVELFEGRFRFNPLTDWGPAQINAHMIRHNLPAHPLTEDGYLSIGCQPCTRRVRPGEGIRDGRWAGLDKEECGIHFSTDIGLR
jgi:phosphoadenosine phosphosulfate reductase